MAAVAGGRLAREVERRQGNARAFASAAAACETEAPVFGDVAAAALSDLRGERSVGEEYAGEAESADDPMAFLRSMQHN